MNTIYALLVLAGLLGGLLAMLQWNHHRTAGWPGSTPQEPDADLRRIWLDLMAGRH